MTPITLLGLLFASQVPPDFIPVDWRNLPVRTIQGPVAARAAAPVTKVLRILVVPMRYADQDSTYSSDTLSRVFSGPYPYVTVNQYFAEQSGGQFQVDAKVIGWQKLSLTKAQALALPERTRQIRFRNEAAAALLRAGVNLADYDYNGDKLVDGLMIMYAGKSNQEDRDAVQGNALVTQASINDTVIGEFRVRQNIFISEVRNDRPSTPGPIAHELSHMIGASDSYDTDATLYGKSGGLGYWDLMSSGSHGLMYDRALGDRKGSFKPTGMSTWVKDDLGFISPPWVDSAQEIRLKPGQAAKVWTDPYRSRQFLYLENRNRSGVDSILPGPGLFVTRVRTSHTLESSSGIAYAINDDPTDMGMEILEASGEQRIGRQGYPNPLQADLFAGSVDSLTDRGPVSLALPDGTPSEASLRRIRMDGSDILVDVTPSPKHGYALSSRVGKVTTPSTLGPSNAQFVYGFRCPTSGAVVAARLALPQDVGPSNLQIWKSLSSIQSAGTPLFSKALKASQSNGSQYYWADVPNPILVNEGDTIFVSQKLGTDSLSRLYAKNYDAPPSNSPCWRFVPGYATSKDPSYCPVVDLVIEHEGGSSVLRSIASAQRFRAKMDGHNLSISGAGSGEIIQAQMRDLRGSLTWLGSIVCDPSGNGQLRLDRTTKGLRILEVRGVSGSQVLTEMVP
ncbi:MAG: M6 family metalloprotease domain-containing protein [Fibrobacteres bacterium]|nr:M6 family metalloprotease domain-containing protein [Fibrobacterota bacterium]